MAKNVTVRWARNTATDLEVDVSRFSNVKVEYDEDDIILINESDEMIAQFGRHDVDVFLVED
jgi:hypothetical protein